MIFSAPLPEENRTPELQTLLAVVPPKAPNKAKDPKKKREGLRIQDPKDGWFENIRVLSWNEEEGDEGSSSPKRKKGGVRGHREDPCGPDTLAPYEGCLCHATRAPGHNQGQLL